jgi:hypothetical protein
MATYWVSARNITPNASNDLITIISAANRRVKLRAVSAFSHGTTASTQQVVVSRSTAGTTPGAAAALQATHADFPTASTTTATTWAAQPSLTAGAALTLDFGGNSGLNRLQNQINTEIEARNGECISIRPLNTGVNMTINCLIEE